MRTLAAIALVTTLSGCGFHLRGSGSQFAGIEGERIFVSDSRATTVAAQVRSQLGLAGAALTASVGDANYRLLIANERLDREVLSVSPQTGKIEEYQLLLRVSLSITAASGETLVDRQQISLSRDFTYDEDAALGKFSEEQLLREEMTREAADQILRRLGAQISKKTG
ncbi:MAG TPA: LPS assembly lipoprotein LptE [Gammaproteobacteria bacterium]|jgi:LPS-assembly lipoprotein